MPDQFTTYRFINVKSDISNFFPAVTVRFDVDNVKKELHCWWTICSYKDQFNKEEGRRIVDERANDEGDQSPYYISLDYFDKYSLKDNFKTAVQLLAEDKSLYHNVSKFLYRNLILLHESLFLIENINRVEVRRNNIVKDRDFFDSVGEFLSRLRDRVIILAFKLRGWA